MDRERARESVAKKKEKGRERGEVGEEKPGRKEVVNKQHLLCHCAIINDSIHPNTKHLTTPSLLWMTFWEHWHLSLPFPHCACTFLPLLHHTASPRTLSYYQMVTQEKAHLALKAYLHQRKKPFWKVSVTISSQVFICVHGCLYGSRGLQTNRPCESYQLPSTCSVLYVYTRRWVYGQLCHCQSSVYMP